MRGDSGFGEGTADEVVINRIAARQHGAVSRSQLLEGGVPAHRIDYRLRRGRLTALHHGVYAVGPVPGRYRKEMAAALAGGVGVAVGSRSAAAMHSLVDAPPGTPVVLITERDLRIRDPGLRIRRCASLPDDEVTRVQGVPVTTPARTLLDLAATRPPEELELVAARARRSRLIRAGDLEEMLRRHPHRPGRRRFASLLEPGHGPAFTRSVAERRFLALVRDARLPEPQVNARLRGLEVDFLWRKQRLVVEVDGRAYHSDTAAFERDHQRDGGLTAAGYAVMRVTWKQIVDEPQTLVAWLAQALTRREP